MSSLHCPHQRHWSRPQRCAIVWRTCQSWSPADMLSISPNSRHATVCSSLYPSAGEHPTHLTQNSLLLPVQRPFFFPTHLPQRKKNAAQHARQVPHKERKHRCERCGCRLRGVDPQATFIHTCNNACHDCQWPSWSPCSQRMSMFTTHAQRMVTCPTPTPLSNA